MYLALANDGYRTLMQLACALKCLIAVHTRQQVPSQRCTVVYACC